MVVKAIYRALLLARQVDTKDLGAESSDLGWKLSPLSSLRSTAWRQAWRGQALG